MAIRSISVEVKVKIKEAKAKLEELADELEEVADKINQVDARGSEGIDINTSVDDIDAELATTAAKMEAFEQSQSLTVPFEVHDRTAAEIFGRMGRDADELQFGRMMQDLPAAADLDFGGFNVPRSAATPMRDDGDGGQMHVLRRMQQKLSDTLDTVGNFDIRMSDLHNAMARLVPLLVIFLGALPAAIAGLYTLAAAAAAATASLAAIAGFGALGVALQDGQFSGQRLQDVLMQIRDDFIDAFAPLAERLQPLFMDAVDAMDRFFQSIANQGDALMELTGMARGFGQFVMEFVPDALRAIAALAGAFENVFANIGNFLQRNFTDIMRTAVDVAQDVIPVLANMVLRIGRAIPALVRMSIGFMQVANFIMSTVGAVADLLGILGITPRMFGLVVAGTLAAATAFLLWNSSILAVASGALMRLGAAIIGTIARMAGFQAATVLSTIATWGLYRALAALVGLTGVGLVLIGLSQGAAAMADNFMKTSSSIDEAASSLKEFDRIAGRTGSSVNPYKGGTQPADAALGPNGAAPRVTIESSGNPRRDKSNANKMAWKMGRTTGGKN